MKRFFISSAGTVLSVACMLGVQPAIARPGSAIYGRWMTDDRAGIVDIHPCGGSLCGTLVRVLDPAAPKRDINNPDPKLRQHGLEGTRILSGLNPAGDIWKGGLAHDPKAGRSYKASIALASPTRLDVTGCVLFLCRTKHWTRVSGSTAQ